MESSLESIKRVAESLADLGADRESLSQRARRLVDRIGAEQFHLAVLGEFKRGKSTLINALLGQSLLPSGVIPVTAVATEVQFGSLHATVEYLDGSEQEIAPDSLADFVTETGNPENQLKVARVIVDTPAPLLEPGLVLVDTPGIASIHIHNTQTAMEALKDTDGAIVVLSVDSPISENDKGILTLLRDRETRTFVVVNKVDHLSESEVAEVTNFISSQIGGIFGSRMEMFFVAARPALDSILNDDSPGKEAGEFTVLRSSLQAFVNEDLIQARLVSAHTELRRLSGELDDSINVEQAASELGLETLRARVSEFRAAAVREREAHAENEALLVYATEQLKHLIGEQLSTYACQAPSRYISRLEEVAATVPKRKLEDSLHAAIEQSVRDGFEELRQREADRADQAWSLIASDFHSRAQARVDAVRGAASDLFDVHLPRTEVLTVTEERERFFYFFVHIEGLGSGISRFARLLLPATIFRRRALRGAKTRLADDFDMHAGRARWDLCQRLDQAVLRFQSSMRREVEQAEQSILSAASNAEKLLGTSVAEQANQRVRREELKKLTCNVRSVVG